MTEMDDIRHHALAKPGTTEELPFGPDTLVFKVRGKMFGALALAEEPLRLNLKCDPYQAIELRARHPEHILPGFHMNKRHWNSLVLDGRLRPKLVRHLINHSYELVVSKLPKREREALATDTGGLGFPGDGLVPAATRGTRPPGKTRGSSLA
jgi:predicted DNA-binding protein (MmcQ/YjbR family)